MAMSFTFSNILQFFSAISSILLAFFMIMISLFNQDVKAIIYLAGAFIAYIFNVAGLKPALGNKIIPESRNPVCDIVDIPVNNKFDGPNANSVFIGFTHTENLQAPPHGPLHVLTAAASHEQRRQQQLEEAAGSRHGDQCRRATVPPRFQPTLFYRASTFLPIYQQP